MSREKSAEHPNAHELHTRIPFSRMFLSSKIVWAGFSPTWLPHRTPARFPNQVSFDGPSLLSGIPQSLTPLGQAVGAWNETRLGLVSWEPAMSARPPNSHTGLEAQTPRKPRQWPEWLGPLDVRVRHSWSCRSCTDWAGRVVSAGSIESSDSRLRRLSRTRSMAAFLRRRYRKRISCIMTTTNIERPRQA